VRPAVDVYERLAFDPGSVRLPDVPDGVEPTLVRGATVSGIPVGETSVWRLLFGLYGYLLPLVLLAAWVSLALWDLARRQDLGRGARIIWVLVVLIVPVLGVVAYHLAGRSPELPGWLRATVVVGGLASYLLVLAAGALLGGIV
jgi:hypothetical protein